jgi:uncharacterized protein YdeI (YjbR/CyaY-like superfamily)
MMTKAAEPTFFETEADFRRWLAAHHDSSGELLVGFWKKGSGKPSIDWPQARDQALCFGWIDGVRKSMGEESYTIRFTPRRRNSVWSKINLARFEALKADGQMTAAGERALAESTGPRGVYAYEKGESAFSPAEEKQFRRNKAAWADWQRRPPSYRKTILHWVTSARKPETRARRLATLIEDSEAGRKVGAGDIGRKKEG